MGSLVLTEASNLSCGPAPDHGGTMSPSGESKLTVAGRNVLTIANVKAASIQGCQHQVNNVLHNCKTVTDVSQGVARRLTVGGVPVVTADLRAPVRDNSGVSVTATDAQDAKLQTE